MPTYDELFSRSTLLVKRAKELFKTYEDLETFGDSTQWDIEASALIDLFKEEIIEVLDFKKSEQQTWKELKDERESKSFLLRNFSSKKAEKEHEENIIEMDEVVTNINSTIENLQELIDSTPNSKAEQKEILDTLKFRKKELTLEKKEVNESIRQINTQARKEISKVSGLSRGFIGDVARYDRMSIRHQKESALRPNEDAKTAINRQLHDVEKKILWVSHFKGDGNLVEQSILLCSYCGRRVNPGEPCKSCGSIQSELFHK